MVIFICLFVYVRTSAAIHEVAHCFALKYSDLLEDAVTRLTHEHLNSFQKEGLTRVAIPILVTLERVCV